MLTLKSIDPALSIESQFSAEVSPVVLINTFTLGTFDEQAFLKLWEEDAAFMKRQPGFISTQLHRAVGKSATYLNYAVWESTASFKAAFTHPEFQAKLTAYPSSVVAMPYLFQKITIPDS